jgi:NAD(P)-dependent dehydrogenase (short-subunit alcohol dehydrogenase family)
MTLLRDKIVLVTGAGAGIGRAVALAMAEQGAVVAAADIDADAAGRTATQAAGKTKGAVAIEADCGDLASIDRMVARAVAEFGRLDVIVNNAGVTRYAYIMDLTEADWDRIHRVNAKGVFFCLQRAAREMIRQFDSDGSGGRIINMASISGRGYPGASNAAYAASKGAVIALTKMAAQQLGRYNINVNSICPGVTRTELGTRNSVNRAAERGITVEQMQREQEAAIPIRRANTPDDIAALAVFLASPGARNITGQSINVDGGLVPS